MAKAKSKELPHFSKLLNIISEHQKNFDSIYKTSNWRNNVDVLNSLINILVKDTYPELENWWAKKGGYGSSEGANFKNIDNKKQRKFIPSKIWKYYAGEMLESENLSYNDHIEKIENKINSLDKKPHFLTEKFCDELYKYFKEYSTFSSVGDMNLRSLETNIRSKNYARFLAEVLFFIAADMPDASSRQINSTPIIKSCNDFFSDILKDLEEGKYYDYYHRKVMIITDIENERIKNENTLSFKSPILNRNEPNADFIKFNFGFETLERYNACNVVNIKINGEDFLGRHNPLPDEPEVVKSDRACYKKRFIYSGVPAADFYEVTRTTETLLTFPVSESVYRLPYSTNDFKFEIDMSQENPESNMYFDIVCAFFTPFSMNKRLSFIKSSSKHFSVHIKEFVPKGTGVKVIIKPLLKNLELDIKPPKTNRIYLEANAINITGTWKEVPDEEYQDQ